MRLCAPLALAGALVVMAACHQAPARHAAVDGDPARGAALIARAGCGACHQIPGVQAARGLVAPPLRGVARRTTIAGVLPNTPANMASWLRAPQAIVPGNAMPDMGLSERDGRDITAYLYTLD